MTNGDLKRLIAGAYDRGTSERKKDFLRTFRGRELHYGEMLGIQFRYLGPQLTAVYGYALAILLGTAANCRAGLISVLPALMPAAALTALTGLGKSERCRMEEIEAASRFSLRLILTLRLALVGMAGLAVMLAGSLVLKAETGTDWVCSFSLAGIPYLLTTFLCMLLIRKWHSPKNIYGCIGIACAVCAVMSGGTGFSAAHPSGLIRLLLPLLLAASAALTVREACRYCKESEDLSWNLC